MKAIDEIVVISGKGGTGKTTITACLADIIGDKVIADCDVDAANMHILLKPTDSESHGFSGMKVAQIDTNKCINCDICESLCRFDAISPHNSYKHVDPLSCEGCGFCKVACPLGAVEMIDREVGQWFISQSQCGDFIHARLTPGAENSGKLVAMVKKQARLLAEEKKYKTVLVDGPPGIGCTVIASISGASLVIIVTEPTQSGLSDLKRAVQLTGHFGIKSAIVINRFDVNIENTAKIESFARENNLPIWAKVPHSSCLLEEICQSRIPSRNCIEIAESINTLYGHIEHALKKTKPKNQERRASI